MATRTTTQSGNWGDASTWVGGLIPGDGDIIAAGNIAHILTVDADYTGWTTGVGVSSFGGTISVKQVAGTYGLKISGTLFSSGKFSLNGGAGVDLPSNIIFKLNFGGNVNLGFSGAHDIRCTEPAQPVLTCKTANNSGVSKIYVNETITDALWVNGYYIRVDNVAATANSEEYTIAATGVDGGGQYVTLSAGLTTSKLINARIILCQRNIQITGTGSAATGQYFWNNGGSGAVKCAMRNVGRPAYSAATIIIGGVYCGYESMFVAGNQTVSNAVFSGGGGTFINSGTAGGVGSSFTGCTISSNGTTVSSANRFRATSCNFCGNTNGIATTYDSYCINCTFIGGGTVFSTGRNCHLVNSNCTTITTLMSTCSACKIIGGTFISCATILGDCRECYLYGATISGHTYLQRYCTNYIDSCTVTGGTDYYQCNSLYMQYWTYGENSNLGSVGAFSSQTCGGLTTNEGTIIPVGWERSYKHVCSNVNSDSPVPPCFRQNYTTIEIGRTLEVTWYMRTANTGLAPKIEIINEFLDPLVDTTQSPLATVSMSSPDTTGNWETGTLTYTNNSTVKINVIIRASGTGASGTFYENFKIENECKPAVGDVRSGTARHHFYSTTPGTLVVSGGTPTFLRSPFLGVSNG